MTEVEVSNPENMEVRDRDETDFMLWRFEYIWIGAGGECQISMGSQMDKHPE